MYDFPAVAGATDRYWALIRDGLRSAGLEAPDNLTRGGDLWAHWRAADLRFGQTCGAPFRNHLHGHVTLIGTPDHALPGCAPGHYNSVFVVRKDDPRDNLAAFDGAAFAFNEAGSQSGWAAPQVHARAAGITLLPALKTGAHQRSALAVAEGRADIAALDAVTYALLCDQDPVVQRLRVLDRTQPTPGLPYIAAAGSPKAILFAAVAQAIAGLAPPDRAALHLHGLVDIPAARYLEVPNPPPPDEIMRDAAAMPLD